jgi:hypothetical protein
VTFDQGKVGCLGLASIGGEEIVAAGPLVGSQTMARRALL